MLVKSTQTNAVYSNENVGTHNAGEINNNAVYSNKNVGTHNAGEINNNAVYSNKNVGTQCWLNQQKTMQYIQMKTWEHTMLVKSTENNAVYCSNEIT